MIKNVKFSDKFKYADIEKGANKRGFESAIDWLIASEMVYKCKYVNKVEQPELKLPLEITD